MLKEIYLTCIEKTINYHKNGFFGTVKYSHRGPIHYGTNIKKHYKQVSFTG